MLSAGHRVGASGFLGMSKGRGAAGFGLLRTFFGTVQP